MLTFKAKIFIIGINPYVIPPQRVLKGLFEQAGKDKGPIQVRVILDGRSFKQNLLKYSGKWRLYLNTPMRKAAGKDVGDIISVGLEFDPKKRVVPMHPDFKKALAFHKKASEMYHSLNPSTQKEILRYIASLKTETSIKKNINRAIQFLSGKGRFIGRDRPE